MSISTLYHYTSIDNLLKILGVENDKLCFRATHAHFMNDPSEYNFAISILKKSMIDYERRKKITDKKSKYLENESNIFSGLSFLGGEPYLFSFSEYSDNLTMWRTYGKDGTGVSIGFDYEMLKQYCKEDENYNTSIVECVYHYKGIVSELIKYWESNYDDVEISNDGKAIGLLDSSLFFKIGELCFKIKCHSYKIEKEWRLCKNDFKDENIKFRVSQNVIVPFIEHYFDKSIIKKIVIGPSIDSELSKKGIEMLLRKYKYETDIDFVVASKISYRQI